jgi:hypothetical protein
MEIRVEVGFFSRSHRFIGLCFISFTIGLAMYLVLDVGSVSSITWVSHAARVFPSFLQKEINASCTRT